MTELIVVEPVFHERVWGGTRLRQWYGDRVPPGVIGEGWVVSGLPGQAGVISSGAPAGVTLDGAWATGLITGEPREDAFPLLCKLLDTKDWLSVQVHPNDAQAQELEEQPRGKAECWYVLECEPGATLILGHTADTAQELAVALDHGSLDELLVTQPVTPGSFFMVPAGCVHAVGPGMLVYEVQQSSDITYRLYDFDRKGLDDQPRELHRRKGFSVVTAPYDPRASRTAQAGRTRAGGLERVLVQDAHFTVTAWTVTGSITVKSPTYRVLTVTAGRGQIVAGDSRLDVERGTSLVAPAGIGPVVVTGELSVLVTDPGRSPDE